MVDALLKPYSSVTTREVKPTGDGVANHLEQSKQNLQSFTRNDSLSSSQNTLFNRPPSLIEDGDGLSDSPIEGDLGPLKLFGPSHDDRFRKAEQEFEDHLSRLLDIDATISKWSGTGDSINVDYDDIKPADVRDELLKGELLGKGGFCETVRKVTCHKIPVAKKSIRAETPEKKVRAEAEVATTKSLASHDPHHRHLMKLVGSYLTNDPHTSVTSYHILTFPVADYDLKEFLDAYVAAREVDYGYAPPEIRRKLSDAAAFEMPEGAGLDPDIHATVRSFLNKTMGCMADAVMWMHSKDVQIAHQDLKPANILLRNGRLYVTLFGISRERKGSEEAHTELVMGKSQIFSAPEIEYQEAFIPYRVDVYSLGCIFLHLLTVMYGTASIKEVNNILQSSRQARGNKIHDYMLGFVNPGPTPKYVAERTLQKLATLIEDMLNVEEENRPKSSEINRKLREIGGQESAYHSACCALLEATPAEDYKVIRKITGMEVNPDPEDELERQMWARDRTKSFGVRDLFATASSQTDQEQSMFGLGGRRNEHAGTRNRPSSIIASRMADFIEKRNLERKQTLP